MPRAYSLSAEQILENELEADTSSALAPGSLRNEIPRFESRRDEAKLNRDAKNAVRDKRAITVMAYNVKQVERGQWPPRSPVIGGAACLHAEERSVPAHFVHWHRQLDEFYEKDVNQRDSTRRSASCAC